MRDLLVFVAGGFFGLAVFGLIRLSRPHDHATRRTIEIDRQDEPGRQPFRKSK